MIDFKPNIYPIIYWGLAYGLTAAIVLVLITFLADLIGYFGFIVFLAGLIWGGYRNYLKQKRGYEAGVGVTSGPQSPVQEFRQAVGDIVEASRELFQQEATSPVNQQTSEPVDQQPAPIPEPPPEPTPPEKVPPQSSMPSA
jgi:hypothetical protein